jgi:catechol 2,3-dioxygenase-like lactoylglutathione lyase family enzyme
MRAQLLGAVLAILTVWPRGAEGQPARYDHVHLAAADAARAAQWYVEHLGGRAHDRPDRIIFGTITFSFLQAEGAKPSSGSVADHLGFSFADVNAKMKELEAAGAKVVTPARDDAGLFMQGMVEDPWGTRLEILQDPQLLGFHHIHLRVADPEASLKWYVEMFGGQRSKLKGRIEGLKYANPDVWLFVDRADATVPSAGHAIDHISWRLADLDGAVAAMKAKNVKVTTEPRDVPRPTENLRIAMIEDPAGVKIELTRRTPK